MIKTSYPTTSRGTVRATERHYAYCDLCGAREEGPGTVLQDTAVGWSMEENGVADTHLCCVEGTWERRGGGPGRVKRTEFHLCPTCFRTKLVAWMRTQGAKPSVWRHNSDDSP